MCNSHLTFLILIKLLNKPFPLPKIIKIESNPTTNVPKLQGALPITNPEAIALFQRLVALSDAVFPLDLSVNALTRPHPLHKEVQESFPPAYPQERHNPLHSKYSLPVRVLPMPRFRLPSNQKDQPPKARTLPQAHPTPG